MCGIVGYIGARRPVPILLEGLKRLEYRGYDSAGVAVALPEGVAVRRRAGRIEAKPPPTEWRRPAERATV